MEQPESQPAQMTLSFGAMADPLTVQLRQQRFKFDTKTIKGYQHFVESYLMLRISGYLSESESASALSRINKSIVGHVKKRQLYTYYYYQLVSIGI